MNNTRGSGNDLAEKETDGKSEMPSPSEMWMRSESGLSVKFVDDQTRAELGLEPCGLRRHDVACISDVDELIHGHGIKGEGHLHLTAVDTAFQLAQTADTAHEVDTLVGAQVGDAEYVAQDEVGAYRYVKHSDRILVVVCAGLGCE